MKEAHPFKALPQQPVCELLASSLIPPSPCLPTHTQDQLLAASQPVPLDNLSPTRPQMSLLSWLVHPLKEMLNLLYPNDIDIQLHIYIF